MNKLYDKYPVSQRRVKPRLHPVVQLAVNEYNAAHREKHDFHWSVLMVDTVAPLCQQQAAQNPQWHLDISSPSLDSYFGEIGPNRLWWNFPPELAPLPDNGAHITSYLCMCHANYPQSAWQIQSHLHFLHWRPLCPPHLVPFAHIVQQRERSLRCW